MQEHESINILKEIVFPFINFGLLVAALVYLLKRPLKDFLLARSKKIAESIEQAAQEKQQAEAKALNYEKRLQNIEKEIQELIHSFQKEGELVRQKIMEEAQSSSQRIQSTAELISRQEYLKVKERLKQEMVGLATTWAEKLVREQMNPKDLENRIQKTVKEVEALV